MHEVARELIGCELLVGGVGGVIVETESYERDDPACHAYVGLTPRTATLFGPPGHAYVYLSYGIHSLLNFVCEPEGSAAAVLIRALEPTTGIERDARAAAGAPTAAQLCSGPGKLTEALGDRARAQRRATRPGAVRAVLALAGPAPGRGRDRPADRDHEGDRAPLALLRRGQPVPLAAAAAEPTAAVV